MSQLCGAQPGEAMSEYEDFGEIALWPNKEAQGRQPVVRGYVTLPDGERMTVSLWRSTSDNPKAPSYWGKVQRVLGEGSQGSRGAPQGQQGRSGGYQQQPQRGAPQQGQMPVEDDFDDDIPF